VPSFSGNHASHKSLSLVLPPASTAIFVCWLIIAWPGTDVHTKETVSRICLGRQNITDSSVGPENGNNPLGPCLGTTTESTCSFVQFGDSRDDGDSSHHFIFCHLWILRDVFYCQFSQEAKDKNGSILSAPPGVINRVNVFILSPCKEPQVILKISRKVVRKGKQIKARSCG